MKATLDELRDLVLFTKNSNNSLIISMKSFMFTHVVEPIQQGVYESAEIDEYFFQDKEDVLKGFDFLEEIGADFNQVVEINL